MSAHAARCWVTAAPITVPAIAFDTEATWKTVSASTGSGRPTCRTPNPFA